MKKIFAIICVIGFVLCFLGGCNSDKNTLSPEITTDVAENNEADKGTDIALNLTTDKDKNAETTISEDKEEQKEVNADKALLDNIIITYKADTIIKDGKQRIIVYVENKSQKIYSGNIHLYFENNSGKNLGSDMVIIEDLGVGQKTWCNVYITPSDDIRFSYKFASDYKFTEPKKASEGELDEVLSQSLAEMMYENFGGAWNPEFATSWYQYIKQLEVYKKDNEYYAVAIVTTNNESNIKTIGNAILFNFRDVNLKEVFVRDEAGNILFQNSK